MGIVKVEEQFISIPDATGFNVLGDPGCDGLGAATMAVFAKALSIPDDGFTLIAGDIVPTGAERFYKNVVSFVNTISNSAVYALKGNHDKDDYEKYFGSSDYMIHSERFKLICLDNSRRRFSPETLDFLQKALEFKPELPTAIAFHIPPPNDVNSNSVDPPEWEEFRAVYAPFAENIAYFISGHLHSYFESAVDGIPIVVTGGAGARIEFVNDKIDQSLATNHIVKFSFTDDRPTHERVPLDDKKYEREISDPEMRAALENALSKEASAHLGYKIFAESARDAGFANLARLFEAVADAEYQHAKNHFMALDMDAPLAKHLDDSIAAETYEVSTMYRQYLEQAKSKQFGLAAYSFLDAIEAEKIHKTLFEAASKSLQAGEDIPVENYATCLSCGYTFHGDGDFSRCPVCGAPKDKIKRYPPS